MFSYMPFTPHFTSTCIYRTAGFRHWT